MKRTHLITSILMLIGTLAWAQDSAPRTDVRQGVQRDLIENRIVLIETFVEQSTIVLGQINLIVTKERLVRSLP